jgi:CHAT domain
MTSALDFMAGPETIASAHPLAGLPVPGRPDLPPPPSPELTAAPPESLPQAPADPLQKLPPGTAVLHVQFNGGGITVQGRHEEIELPLTGGDHYAPPKLALADLAKEGGVAPVLVVYLMPEWSESHYEIVDWIVKLRQRVGDDELRLVIWDDTGLEIPWELLWIDPGDGPPGWLGALVPVVRWTTIHWPRISQGSSFSDPPAECRGEIAAYVDPTMRDDLTVLERSGTVKEFTAAELPGRINEPSPPLGLVYVAAHGECDPHDVTTMHLGNLVVTSLSPYPRPGTLASRSLVFLNGCHSGRLIEDARLNDGFLRGFVQAFIKLGAAAVIGTTGAVGMDQARLMAEEIITKLAADDAPHVAVVLRDARARFGAGVTPATRDNEALLPFLYANMYVCYGNTRTSARLKEKAR